MAGDAGPLDGDDGRLNALPTAEATEVVGTLFVRSRRAIIVSYIFLDSLCK
jgi:hypothetical protein